MRATLAWTDPAHWDSVPPPLDFARLVGADGWHRLPEAIRRRFAHAPAIGAMQTYAGTMEVVECSRAGFALAQLCRLIGTPFAPFPGTGVPVTIRLSADGTGRGIVWDRIYRYAGRPPVLVRSTKQAASDGGLLEVVGGGFGMAVRVYELDAALHFESQRYFWRCAGRRLPLPDTLTPGAAHVVHTDLGDGRFRFEMTFTHPRRGVLFRQDGIFAEETVR